MIQLFTKTATSKMNFVVSQNLGYRCPSQPCTTLDDLLLNNSLSNISNVEFKLLPGVYHVTSNIVIQHVHNVSFGGVVNESVDEQQVIIACHKASLILSHSCSVTIASQHCGSKVDWELYSCTEDELEDSALYCSV